jgi:hypothetical protein
MSTTNATHAYCPECRFSAVRLKRGGTYEAHRRSVETLRISTSRTERCPGSGTIAAEAHIDRWVAWALDGARNTATSAAERLRVARVAFEAATGEDISARERLAAITAIAAARKAAT